MGKTIRNMEDLAKIAGPELAAAGYKVEEQPTKKGAKAPKTVSYGTAKAPENVVNFKDEKSKKAFAMFKQEVETINAAYDRSNTSLYATIGAALAFGYRWTDQGAFLKKLLKERGLSFSEGSNPWTPIRKIMFGTMRISTAKKTKGQLVWTATSSSADYGNVLRYMADQVVHPDDVADVIKELGGIKKVAELDRETHPDTRGGKIKAQNNAAGRAVLAELHKRRKVMSKLGHNSDETRTVAQDGYFLMLCHHSSSKGMTPLVPAELSESTIELAISNFGKAELKIRKRGGGLTDDEKANQKANDYFKGLVPAKKKQAVAS